MIFLRLLFVNLVEIYINLVEIYINLVEIYRWATVWLKCTCEHEFFATPLHVFLLRTES